MAREPNIHEAHRLERRGRRLPALVIVSLVVVLGATWVGLFGFMTGNSAFGTVEDLEDRYICDVDEVALEFPNLSTLSEVYTDDGVLLGKLTERNSQPVTLDEMPELVVAALLSAEDKDFYSHEGINFKAIFRAALANYNSSGVQGGSTLTQQVVKANFLTAERTIERKLCEAVVAAELEQLYTKDEILEFYMNSVFYGSNAYGAKAAAQEYFGEELTGLTVAQAATLFVPVRNPTIYHPRNEPSNTIAARNRTINQMVANGFISERDAASARGEPLDVIAHAGFEELAPPVMIAVRQQLLRNEEYGLGDDPEERKRAVFGCPASDTSCEGGGGLKIHVTIDYDLQEEANRILRAWFQPGFGGPTGAIAAVDNRTGAIRVMASGLDFGTDLEAGQRPYDLASEGGRQVGSAFKPFTLAAALEYGRLDGQPITLGSYWDKSSPAEIDCGFPCYNGSNIWPVRNFNPNTPQALESLEAATYNSRNTVYARVVDSVGPEQVVEMAERLGIQGELRPYPSITLGVFDVSPLEMASAYSVFATQGQRYEPYLIERIEDADGNVVFERDPMPTVVLSPSIAAAVNSTLQLVVAEGTGRRADIERPQGGKTGTATDARDVMFVGYVPQLTTAVWAGYADGALPLEDFVVWNDLEGEEQYFRAATGGQLAAPIWKQFMLEATKGTPPIDFAPEPPGTAVYRQTPFATVPDVGVETTDGSLDAGAAVDLVFASGLAGSVVEVASEEEAGTVVGTSPLAGTRLRQGSSVEVHVSSGVPPEVGMPDLRGIDVGDVASTLAEFRAETGVVLGWVVQDVFVVDPQLSGKVVRTDPTAGNPVTNEQTVTLYVGVQP